jgi:hypothetical protein
MEDAAFPNRTAFDRTFFGLALRLCIDFVIGRERWEWEWARRNVPLIERSAKVLFCWHAHGVVRSPQDVNNVVIST